MSAILGNAVPGAGGGVYTIDNSVRLRQSASAYLSRTPASATNRKTWTYSAWVKRSSISSDDTIFAARTGGGATYLTLVFNAQNDLRMESDSETAYPLYKTNAVFRDPSSWYHIVVALDMTQATSTDRLKVYVNGVLQTAASYNVPAQNTDLAVNSTETHLIGQQASGSYFDGYLANINFIDGQALTPSSFGETNASTGVWQPKAYTGTYGTNGFYLKFSDIATTSGSNAGLGKDFSGNGNYWNTNNISVTSGYTYDAMTDSPTPASATVGNFAVMNPLARMQGTVGASNISTISNANLTAVPSANNNGCQATFGLTSGKWYWEVNVVTGTISNNVIVGISYNGSYALYDYGVGYEAGGNKSVNGTSSAYGSSTTTNDVIGIALDVDASTVTFYKNNTSQGTISYTATSLPIFPAYWSGGGVSANHAFNFGQRPFAYTPPTGYVRLETYNLPTPTIGASSTTLANKYFNTVLYTGNGSTQSISGVGFQPDFVWIKERSSTSSHALVDSVRGAGAHILVSNSTAAEDTSNDQIFTSFNADGFSVGTNNQTNESSQTYVGWNWKANGTGVTNTAGSITSTVSANTTSGFSVATFTPPASGTSFTVGHGLGSTPKMIITKIRNNGAANWFVYHQAMGNTGYMALNATNGNLGPYTAAWNNTSPTSTVATFGSYWIGSSYNMVAYFFADVTGFSKFGSYTGNGSTDGTFVYTGFRPKYVMFKRTDTTGNWEVFDGVRNPYNVTNLVLEPNNSNAEYTGTTDYALDLTSNGFKFRGTGSNINASGGTYIYMAFAESPFNYSLAR